MKLAERTFHAQDQQRFAEVSGDWNPMHMDALLARRTQAGAPVVHGIHLLLWALESLAASQPELPPVRGIRAQFHKFIFVDEPAEVTLTQQTARGVRLTIGVDGVFRSKVSVEFGEATAGTPDWAAGPLESIPFQQVAMDLSLEQIEGRSGRLEFPENPAEEAATIFPSACRWLGAGSIVALAASTRLVGMVCPGLHSIYSEIAVNSAADSILEDGLAFRVTETDRRFRSVEQEIAGGGLVGTVRGFARNPPVAQATMASLAEVVSADEFAGSVALIVGGSRGLGELTAKLLAAGGATVILTWQRGKVDAERVAQEIQSAGGACHAMHYDAGAAAAPQLAALSYAPTHAYYFATPSIFRPQAEIFRKQRLDEFLAIYVHGFWELARALRQLNPKIALYYPSSVSVAERPEGMTEYTMAKAAGEVLCADINTSMAPMRVIVTRLPRLETDQTATVTATESASPIETVLPILRAMHGTE